MAPTWKKVAEDRNDDHPEHGREHRTKWEVTDEAKKSTHTVSTTQHEKVLHVKVDKDYLMFTTPEKAMDYVVKKVSGE